jgi:hypothetical protein
MQAIAQSRFGMVFVLAVVVVLVACALLPEFAQAVKTVLSTLTCQQDRAPARLPDLGADPATNEQVDLSNHALTSHAEAQEIWQRIKGGKCEVYCYGEVAYIICPGMGQNVGFVPLSWHWSLNKWLANTAFLMDPERADRFRSDGRDCTIGPGALALAGVFEEVVDD